MSSTFFGAGKSEKQSSKFKGIDINTIYKGSSASQPKTAPTSRQHGLQVLGKVQSIRRMPPPANLPSIKSQSGGNDQNISIVPTGTSSAGWSVTREEKKTASASMTTSTTSTSAAPKSSQLQQAGGPSTHPYQQMETHSVHSNASHGEGGILWSDVTSGGKRNYLDRKSFSLQDDFPELSAGGEEKSSGLCKKEDASRDQQHGQGPSLRPQNVASWRDGGGKGIAQHPPQSPQSHSPSPQRPSAEDGHCAGPPYHQVSSEGIRAGMMPPMMRMAPMPFMGGAMPPMIPPYSQRPHHMMMMPPPYAFRPGFHPPPYPPNFVPQGMSRPPFMGPDFGMRPRMPQPPHPPSSPTASFSSGGGPDGKDKSPLLRSSVVKERDLEQFDKLDISEDNGWARSSVNVDYSEKLVFSDDEENVDKSKSQSTEEGQRSYKWAERGWNEEDRGRRMRPDDSTHSSSSTSFKLDKQLSERSVGEQRPNSVGVLPGDVSDMFVHPSYPGPHGRHPMMYDRQWPGPYDRRMFPPHYGQSLEMIGNEDDAGDRPEEHETKHKPEMSAVERARLRREEEERRLLEHQKTASMQKLRQLEEKIAKKALLEKERASLDEGDENNVVKGSLNKPTSMTSLTSDGSKFVKSQSQQSVECHSSSDGLERPDSNPCPPSHKQQPSPNNAPPVVYQGGAHRMPPPHPTFGYWGGSYDPRWGAVPFPHGYGVDQTRFRMKGQMEHSGSLDDLNQGSALPKHPLPAPPQPHNYYQYHPHNFIHGDPYYIGDYKDMHQRGSCPKDGDKSKGRQKRNSGPDGGYYKNDDNNSDNGSHVAPKKILHPSEASEPSQQRKTILHRKKSESEKSDERAVADARERMCSTSSGVSSKAEEIVYHEDDSRNVEDGRSQRIPCIDSQENQRNIRRFDDDRLDDDGRYNSSHNTRMEHWQAKKQVHKIDHRENKSDIKRSQMNDDNVTAESFDQSHHKEPSQTHARQQCRSDDGKKESVCKVSADVGDADDDCYRSKKSDVLSRNADSPNTYVRKPKPKERPIYQHQQWQRSTCPPPISMDQAEQNQPNSSSYISLKKQQSNNGTATSTSFDRKQESDVYSKNAEKSKQQVFDADRKSLSKESLTSSKKDGSDGADERKRSDNKVQKSNVNYVDQEYKDNNKRQKRDNYYDRDRNPTWKGDDAKEFYSRKDQAAGKMSRPYKAARNDGQKEKPSMNYRGHYDEEHVQSKDVAVSSKEGHFEGKDFYRADGSYYGGNTRNNKRYPHPKNMGRSRDGRSEHNSEEYERTSKKDADPSDHPGRHDNDREEKLKTYVGDKMAESKRDATSQDELNFKTGGRLRGGRGGKGRDYSDMGEAYGEERYRPQGSREFVRGGNKSYGSRGGRDHYRMRGYPEEEDDEWEDERVIGGRGRFAARSGRRNSARKPKVGMKDGQEERLQKKNDVSGKKLFKDHLSPDAPKKQADGNNTLKNGPAEGIPSLMSKTISPPAMAKIAASLQILADSREEKFADNSHGKQGKEMKCSRNDNDHDKNKEENRHADLTRQASYTSSSSAMHRQPHYHRYHHQYHPINNYDRRPRSSRGPVGGGHRVTSAEKNKSTSGSVTAASNSACASNLGISGKDKKQTSEVHNEEWETASEGSEVITSGSNLRYESARPVKENSAEVGAPQSSKKNSSGTRSDKNQRRTGGYNKISSKADVDETAPRAELGPEVEHQHGPNADNKNPLSSKGQSGRNRSINNGNKMAEGSSGDGTASGYGGGECRDANVIDSFPTTGGDGNGKDAQVYYVHEVRFDNQDVVKDLMDRSRRKWLMKIIDP